MATVQWRRNKQVTVYYWDNQAQKLTPLPRDKTRHLDGKPKDVVYRWVEDWERTNGRLRDRVQRTNLAEDDPLAVLWKLYQDFKNSDSDTPRRASTVAEESATFHRHIVPFFVGEHRKKDPADWHPLIPTFHSHLNKLGLAASTRQSILWTLKRFGEALIFSQLMTFPFAIRPPRSKNAKITPLKVRKTPDEIISFVKTIKYEEKDFRKGQINFNLAILLGFFGGFGPGELFALEKSDLITGDDAEKHCKTIDGFRKHSLGSRLAIIVNKTLPAKGKSIGTVPLVKNDYRYGVSNIWDVKAAKLIAAIVKDLPDGRLFPFSYGHLVRQWREQVSPKLGSTPHDLRRASGLYLGRTIRVELTLLQEHMRHAEIETTMLYTRAPAVPEMPKKKRVQDFDDVA
jgi:integrase